MDKDTKKIIDWANKNVYFCKADEIVELEVKKEKMLEIIDKLEMLSAMNNNNGWIPVKEGFPLPTDSDETVLVQVNGRYKNIKFEDALETAWYDKKWYLEKYPAAAISVVAWRPLPEKYKLEYADWKENIHNRFMRKE